MQDTILCWFRDIFNAKINQYIFHTRPPASWGCLGPPSSHLQSEAKKVSQASLIGCTSPSTWDRFTVQSLHNSIQQEILSEKYCKHEHFFKICMHYYCLGQMFNIRTTIWVKILMKNCDCLNELLILVAFRIMLGNFEPTLASSMSTGVFGPKNV